MLFLVDSNPDNKNIGIFEKYHKLIFLSMIKRMKKIKTKNTKNINEKKMKKIQNKNKSLNKQQENLIQQLIMGKMAWKEKATVKQKFKKLHTLITKNIVFAIFINQMRNFLCIL